VNDEVQARGVINTCSAINTCGALGSGTGEIEELAMPADVADNQPGQLGQWRIERLEHRERRCLGAGDDVPAGTLAQEGG